MFRRGIGFMVTAVLLVLVIGNAQAETPFDATRTGDPSATSDNPVLLQKRFQKVIEDSLSRQKIPFRQFSWLSPKFVRRDILELPISIVVRTKRIVLPVYLIDHQYLVTTPLLDITLRYAVVHGTASDKSDLVASESTVSDNSALLQKQFGKVIKESMSKQRIPFRQFTWLSPKFVRRNILSLPFSIVVGTKRIVLLVYLIDHQYLASTPLLDITRHYAIVPHIPPPQSVKSPVEAQTNSTPPHSDVAQNSEPTSSGSPPSSSPSFVAQSNESAPSGSSRDRAEIRRLKRKIAELEAKPSQGDSSDLSREVADMKKSLAAIQTKLSNPPPLRKSSPHYSSSVDRPSFHDPENRRLYAVVVGVEHYPGGIHDAQFADRDAQAVYRHLRALGVPPDHIRKLTDDIATQGRIRGAIRWLARNAKPDSTLWVYFSGHGAPTSKGAAYLVPFGGDPSDLEDTGYSLSDLYTQLNRIHAHRIIVALDACFSGEGKRSVLAQGAKPLVLHVKTGAVPSTGRLVVLSGAQGDQEAGVLETKGHGIFTYYLLKGLDKGAVRHGHVTVASLYRYLKVNVTDAANLNNGNQTPVVQPGLSRDGSVRLR